MSYNIDTMQKTESTVLQSSAEERITQSRVRLLMNKPFFGTLATRLRLQEFSASTAATDGRYFYFNREFIDREHSSHPAPNHLAPYQTPVTRENTCSFSSGMRSSASRAWSLPGILNCFARRAARSKAQ